MAEGDPIDEVFVRLGLDATAFVDGLKEGFDKGLEEAGRFGQEAQEAISAAFSEGLFGATVAETATDLGVTMEEAAAAIKEAGFAAEFTTEQLTQMGKAYQADLVEQFRSVTIQANEEVRTQGKISEETAEKLAMLSKELQAAAAGNQAMAAAAQSAARQTQDLAPRADQVSQAIQQMVGARVGGPLGALVSGIGKMAPALLAATVAFKALDSARQFVDQAVDEVISLSEAHIQLGIAVRANQRAFGEQAGTVEEWTQFAEELSKKYGIMYGETIRATTAANRLTGDLGLNREEIMKLTDAAAVFSQATGTELTGSMRQFAFFLNTGVSRALRMNGIDTSVAAQKQIALALGIRKPTEQWTEQERILIRTTLLYRETDKFAEDVANAQGAMAKQIEQANVALDEQKRALGTELAPLIVQTNILWTKFITAVVEGFSKWAQIGRQSTAAVTAVFITIYEFIVQVTQAFEGFSLVDLIFSKDAQATVLNRLAETFGGFRDNLSKNIGEAIEGSDEAMRVAAGHLGDAFGVALDPVAAHAAEVAEQVDASFNQIAQALDELSKKYEEAAAEIEKNFYDRLEQIDRDFNLSMLDASKDLSRDLEDINRDAAQQKQDAIRDSQRDEIRIRQDHFIRIRNLERRYLFELEDAVRDRDARQVLMLMRRHNIEVAEENESFDLAQQRRREALTQELADIERARLRRRAERYQDYREEIEDVRLQAARKAEEARAERMRALAELMEDNKKAIEAVLAQVAEAGGLSQEVLAGLAEELQTLASQSRGAMQQIAQDAVNFIAQLQAAIGQARSLMGGSDGRLTRVAPGVWSRMATGGGIISHQAGGSFVYTSPQLIRVGERPERVDVTPLGGQGQPLPGFGSRGGGPEGGRVRIEIGLGAGLEGKIVDKAMGDVAEVILNMAQGDPTGFGGATRVGGRQ